MTQRTTELRVLSERTRRTYAAAWSLFTDWCAVTGHRDLAADPATVIAFLADCPAARKTHRGWVAAIDHRHTANGNEPPGRSAPVLAALGRPTGEPRQIPVETAAAVEAALRALPSHGWTQGMFGRRDRCLLVLSQLAGVPYRHLSALTVGEVNVADGTATITTPALTWTLRPADDCLLCWPCAVTRWVRALDLVMTKYSNVAITESLKRADPVTDRSPHLCRTARPIDDATRVVPLLPPIDQWGYVPFPLQRLTPHSLSRRVRDLLSGDLGAHREFPVEETEPERPAPVPVVQRGLYSREDAQRAWARRRADLADIAGVDDILKEIDARARELERRTAAILAGQTDSNESDPRNE
jgi:hypothetical protein